MEEVKDGLIPKELKVFIYGLGLATFFGILVMMSSMFWRVATDPTPLICMTDHGRLALSARKED